MKTFNLTKLQLLLMSGLLLCLTLACNLRPANSSPTPIDPDKIEILLRPLGYQANLAGASLEFEYKVDNQNSSPIYLVTGNRMPYVTVVDPGTVQLRFDLVSTEADVNIFEPPILIKVAGYGVYQANFRINHPFLPSDHFHFPGVPEVTDSSIKVKVVQGYGETGFPFSPPDNQVYPNFLNWQQTIESSELTISSL